MELESNIINFKEARARLGRVPPAPPEISPDELARLLQSPIWLQALEGTKRDPGCFRVGRAVAAAGALINNTGTSPK